MGYFPNGTEGEHYQETHCVKCRNYKDGECPVWTAHEDYQPYVKFITDKERAVQEILDSFIPRGKSGLYNDQCLMFLPMMEVTA